jgi:hypothetical protein
MLAGLFLGDTVHPDRECPASQLRWRIAGKYLAGKPENLCLWIAPCVPGQFSFAAGFGKEFFGAQFVVYRNLGKQQAAVATSKNKQAMSADLDFLGADGVPRRE